MLIHFLVSLLKENAVNEHGIATVLRPLIEYQEVNTRTRARRKKDQMERESLLKTTISEMQNLVQPSRYSRDLNVSANTASGSKQTAISELAKVFCSEGDHNLLLVRLSLLLASGETRDEDISKILHPLVTYHEDIHAGQRERELIWQDVTARVARYAYKVSLKE
jgi:hypothetical protein